MQNGKYIVVTDETFSEEILSHLLMTKGPVLTFVAVTVLACKEISELECDLHGNAERKERWRSPGPECYIVQESLLWYL